MNDAAAHVFAERGYHGASTQDIADRLGIRQASLYYYFKSKEEALRVVCDIGTVGILDSARTIVEGRGTSREKLYALIEASLAPLEDRADYLRVYVRERQYLPAAARKTIAFHARGLEACFEIVVTHGIAHGVFSPHHDPHLATRAILSMVDGAPFWRDRNWDKADITAAAATISRVALGGLTGVVWHDLPSIQPA